MPIKRNDTYEYRNVVKRPDLKVSLLEIGTCKESVLFEQLKKPVNGRIYHTEDTNRFFFDFGNKRFELNILEGGSGEPIDLKDYAKKKDIPTKVSQLRNDSEFITLTSVGNFLRQHDYITEEDLIKSLSEYVSAEDIETLNNRIDSLSADFTEGDAVSDLKGNIRFSLKQEKGKVSSIGVDVSYATITKTDGDSTKDTTLTVAQGDEDKFVLGSDISKLVDFTNKRIGEEINKLNIDLISYDSDDEPVTVSISQEGGKLKNVEVITLGADVSFGGGTISVKNPNGMVLGTDVNELKKYIDSKVASGALTYVSNSNEDNDAISLNETMVDGKLNYDINLVWSEFSNNN